MDKNREILQHISATFDEMVALMKKPRSKFLSILEIAGELVNVAAIIGIIETILKWILGGLDVYSADSLYVIADCGNFNISDGTLYEEKS